ncbi:M56 family metallopeptidase [Mycobacterium asiaticum]|uniref:Peptidase M48 n=1 Tax=Mycobacterium asiaticum TaxID=1790 RepID=A0A1A3L2C4_MYCAS|nr:M56 family metallopeptidase [Mycobacterium asiaticum]OBJ90321.1 peptidase M48 [Mycobacterium asiaticum]
MSFAICLLLYSAAVLVAVPPLLAESTQLEHSPRLGVAAWLMAIGTVLLSWIAAAGMIVNSVAAHWRDPRAFVHSCIAWLLVVVDQSIGVAPITLGLIAATLVLLAAAACVRLARTLVRMRARAHAHAAAVRLVGHRRGDAFVVVEAVTPAAYCVAGRPPAIVVTSGALAALDDRELAAVLAHERAHLNGYHLSVVTALRGVATVFPKLSLMRQGANEVSRLLEMCADDASARRHGAAVLLSGLLKMCRATPEGTLAAADVAVLARAERLATTPDARAEAKARTALLGMIAVMITAPVVTAALTASGVLMCHFSR